MFDDIFQYLNHALNLYVAYKALYLGTSKINAAINTRKNSDWILLINNKFKHKFEIFGILDSLPEISISKHYSPPQNLNQRINEINNELSGQNKPNEVHAKVIGNPKDILATNKIKISTLKYSVVKALREVGKKPALLSTCAVLICEERKRIIFQLRSSKVDTMPNLYHTIGGAFRPYLSDPMDEDRDILESIIREVKEESGIKLGEHNIPKLMLSREISTGFIQLTFLGFNIIPTALDRIKSNWEGTETVISFDELENYLLQSNWVDSGRGQILAWLALGAPGTKSTPVFNDRSAKQVFHRIMKSI